MRVSGWAEARVVISLILFSFRDRPTDSTANDVLGLGLIENSPFVFVELQNKPFGQLSQTHKELRSIRTVRCKTVALCSISLPPIFSLVAAEPCGQVGRINRSAEVVGGVGISEV